MPGIMYHMDNFEKRIVDDHFQTRGVLPKWLGSLGCIEPVAFPRKMTQEYPELGLTLVGMPDAVFSKEDGSLCVVDYKTAKYKGADDPFMPGYEVQLWGYAQLLEHNKIGAVSSAAIVYFENALADYGEKPLALLTTDGLRVPFEVKIHPVELDLAALGELLKKFRKYVDMPQPPEGSEKCKTCQRLNRLFTIEEQLRRNDRATKTLQDNQGAFLRSELRRFDLQRIEALTLESFGWERELEDGLSGDLDRGPVDWDL
jgi:ATP-dependent exoDNAse (exonuclease V) beta subunit